MGREGVRVECCLRSFGVLGKDFAEFLATSLLRRGRTKAAIRSATGQRQGRSQTPAYQSLLFLLWENNTRHVRKYNEKYQNTYRYNVCVRGVCERLWPLLVHF